MNKKAKSTFSTTDFIADDKGLSRDYSLSKRSDEFDII